MGDMDQVHNDQDGIQRSQNPLATASFLSKMCFMWPYALIKEGMVKPIEESDLHDIMQEEKSSHNREYFEKLWQDELQRAKKKKRKPSLHWALAKDFFKSTWIIQPLMCASSTARIVMSLALGYLIESFNDQSNDGYLWAAIIVLCDAIRLFEHHQVFFMTWRKGMQIRIGAVSSIFAKSLRLKSVGVTTSSGQIMNLISNDVERFLLTTLFVSYIIWAPLQAIAILIIGTKMIGPAFTIGIGLFMFVFVPLQSFLAKRFASLRSKVASITDERMTLVGQAISGVRVMKMFGWEHEFENRINRVRQREIKQIHKANRLKALNEALFFAVNVFVSVTIFVIDVYGFNGNLTTRNVFVVITLMSVLQLELAKHLSLGVMAVSECMVSVSRIQKYLETSELSNSSCRSMTPLSGDESDIVISMKDVTCYWDSNLNSNPDLNDSKPPALKNISLDFKRNCLTCIVGSVGSGKSALLHALAGELVPQKGTIEYRCKDSLSYAPQDPWIMNGTIRMNILMGKPYEFEFYRLVCDACGLAQDFGQFVAGDETIVGDRGVQISGGQRARYVSFHNHLLSISLLSILLLTIMSRIGLARALYRDADVLLLDDPLSAVDSRVGRLIFYSAIQSLAVNRGKCVILVTHQHQYVGDSRCILITDGELKCDGSFSNCIDASDGKLQYVLHNAEDLSNSGHSLGGTFHEYDDASDKLIVDKKEDEEAITSNPNESSQDEKKLNGIVSRATFINYAKCMGGLWSAFGLLLIFVLAQAAVLGNIAAIGRWSQLDPIEQKSILFLGAVLGFLAAVVVLSITRSIICFALTIRASKKLHDAMTAAVLKAKIEFFDTNPSGRILNRFSADVGSNDDLLPPTLFDFLMCAFLVAGAIVTAVTALPIVLVVFPPLIWYFIRVRKSFVITSRELKRLEGLARSPIFAMMSESLSGISTIRANGAKSYISKQFEKCHDAHSRAFWGFLSCSRWVGFRMDSIMFLCTSSACFVAVLFSERGWFDVDPVVFGLALSMLIQLGSIFQWTIRQSAEVVNQMVCVERVSEYIKLESEAPLTTDEDKVYTDWPSSGSITVQNLAVRYRSNLPLSLKNISFSVQSGKRLGIIGRTGSGKSTLVQALFRIIEAEEGSIWIDGVDIKQLGLHKLRKGMSVISQHPTLFSGCTIRENLDPFHEYSDRDIIDSLSSVQMIKAINDLPQGIHTPVAESGSNFSVGERQLLCLARAILQKSKILVLDEPTANVDSKTDKLLQEAVSHTFQGATIISVAHRLDTIIGNDIILVLGDGKVLEFGTPAELVANPNSHFNAMLDDTGEAMAADLRRKANSFNNNKQI